MRIFIVGATGYIGRPLLHFSKLNFESFGTSTTAENGLLPLDFVSAKQFDFRLIQESDVILVTAAISSPDVCSREHAHAWAVNVTGTFEFISKVISKGARVIFFSSDTVYGEKADEFDETTVCNPAGDYAVMKHEVERMFLDNPAFKTIRLSYVFSREDKFTKYLIECAERGEETEIFHPFYRAVIHRDDVVQGAIALAQRWDEFPSIINFGGPEVLDRPDFTRILQETALLNLRFRVTEPDADFFKNRPRVIRMASPALASLLGRSAQTLYEATRIEFDREKQNG